MIFRFYDICIILNKDRVRLIGVNIPQCQLLLSQIQIQIISHKRNLHKRLYQTLIYLQKASWTHNFISSKDYSRLQQEGNLRPS
jgi:hypothetical protein